MKLTVIGHWGGYPKVNEASSGYLLEHNQYKLLIDCGSAVLSKLQNFVQPEEINAVILSHYHPDHIADIGVLQHAFIIGKYMKKSIQILSIYGHHEDEHGFQALDFQNVTKGVPYNPDQKLQVGPFSITFLKTKHPVPCYAMRIEVEDQVFVYTADTSYIESLPEFSKDADVLLCECNFYGDMDGAGAGHMNSFDAGKLADLAGAKRLILTHLPQYGDLEQLKTEAAQKFTGEVILAYYGLTIQL